MPDPVPAVRLRGVSKAFGAVHVLRAVDLDVPAGQKLAVIGPSGSGKTSLLRLLMTLEQPDSGEIEVFGERLASDGSRKGNQHLRRVRGQIGMVFQQFNLFPHRSVLENIIEAPTRVRGVPVPAARERAMELLGLVGLAEKANAWPAQLSGGQQQRVAIARALALEPRIILFDEVTSALDPELVGEVLGVIRRLASERSTTMLIVTHEMTFARDTADRVLFMEDGRIVEDAPPSVMFTSPSHERTRRFLKAVLER